MPEESASPQLSPYLLLKQLHKSQPFNKNANSREAQQAYLKSCREVLTELHSRLNDNPNDSSVSPAIKTVESDITATENQLTKISRRKSSKGSGGAVASSTVPSKRPHSDSTNEANSESVPTGSARKPSGSRKVAKNAPAGDDSVPSMHASKASKGATVAQDVLPVEVGVSGQAESAAAIISDQGPVVDNKKRSPSDIPVDVVQDNLQMLPPPTPSSDPTTRTNANIPSILGRGSSASLDAPVVAPADGPSISNLRAAPPSSPAGQRQRNLHKALLPPAVQVLQREMNRAGDQASKQRASLAQLQREVRLLEEEISVQEEIQSSCRKALEDLRAAEGNAQQAMETGL